MKRLHDEAVEKFERMLERQSKTLEDAVKVYQERYGRLPPPNFDLWFHYATMLDSPIIDDYDSIEASIRPLWGLPPSIVRARTRAVADKLGKNHIAGLRIRRGRLEKSGGVDAGWVELELENMLEARMLKYVPDMELAVNMMDEPRVVVPEVDMVEILERARANMEKNRETTKGATAYFYGWKSKDDDIKKESKRLRFKEAPKKPTWPQSKLSCPYSSAVYDRDYNASENAGKISFINDMTTAKNLCSHPEFESQHGFFSGPENFSISTNLIPILSQSKPSSYSDILFPNFWYWNKLRKGVEMPDPKKMVPWEQRSNELYWRGSTTGGYSEKGCWKQHHRQRFLDLISGNRSSTVQTYHKHTVSSSFGALRAPEYTLRSSPFSDFSHLFNVSFSMITQCSPADCSAQASHFPLSLPTELSATSITHKYLLDLDGNAFSGRLYTLLRSGGVVFKQSIFQEWHDERLMPWVHFVPLTMGGTEVFEVMRYFTEEGGDVARRIAEAGTRWMDRGMRGWDMRVYWFRLLLELGRVGDEGRAGMGYVP